MSHYSSEDQIIVIKQRRQKQVHDITCLKVSQRGGATIWRNTVFNLFDSDMIDLNWLNWCNKLSYQKWHKQEIFIARIDIPRITLWTYFGCRNLTFLRLFDNTSVEYVLYTQKWFGTLRDYHKIWSYFPNMLFSQTFQLTF